MIDPLVIFWFRKDLRLSDNPGLVEASCKGSILPIYVFDNNCRMGAASKWWLHKSLTNLDQSLDGKLNVYYGDPKKIILDLVSRFKIHAIYWNNCYDPYNIMKEQEIIKELQIKQIICKGFNGSLLWEPWTILKADSKPYKVFTYFYRNGCLRSNQPRKPFPKPSKLNLIKDPNDKYVLKNLDLLPTINWYQNIEKTWTVGEKEAHRKLNYFIKYNLKGYKENRNYPAKPNVSRLSPYLAFGEISPNQIWYAMLNQKELDHDLDHFLSEVAWREFSYYLLYHFPDLPSKNFQEKFDHFPWQYNHNFLMSWQKGQTGYPIVDAGMRELWQTGYIHNRVRMIVASFLVKNLLLDWRYGEKWFWDCLVDADLANNVASWQWVAGSGADAAPYFRIFNPITQGEKFDQYGEYTKKFVPELKKLPNKYLFKPWESPKEVLKQAGVTLGLNYPKPIVDLNSSRNSALQAYKDLKNIMLHQDR